MMEPAATLLLWGAASVACVHTLIGVDHYLPFIVLGRARKWSLRKALSITALCGVGHVAGSVVLGLLGVGLGVAVQQLEALESVRASLAAWALIAFGLAYAAVSMLRSARGHRHSHAHAHEDGTVHRHGHDHLQSHGHAHELTDRGLLTKWALFLVFVFGPCEALIPMFMVPAYAHNWALVLAVALVFAAVTIATMLAAVAAGMFGLSFAGIGALERHANTLAGVAIAGSGLAIHYLGV